MKTWNDYKDYVKSIDDKSKEDMEAVEEIASIVGVMINQRSSLGISQRDLAALCGMPQSSIARVESMKTIPNLETVVKMTQALGLIITVSSAE